MPLHPPTSDPDDEREEGEDTDRGDDFESESLLDWSRSVGLCFEWVKGGDERFLRRTDGRIDDDSVNIEI